MNRFSLFVVLLLIFSGAKRLSDSDLVLIAINCDRTRAIMKNGVLYVYQIKGDPHIRGLKDAAAMAGAKRLVVMSVRGEESFAISDSAK